MSSWFPGRGFIKKEQRQLREVSSRRERNSRLIRKEQEILQQAVINELSGLKGLTLSFGAGCVAALAFKNREKLGLLKSLPWKEIAQMVQAQGAADSETVTDLVQANNPAQDTVPS